MSDGEGRGRECECRGRNGGEAGRVWGGEGDREERVCTKVE